MPSIQPPAVVLVTGANGFIGSWVVRRLLESGFVVHAAVRSSAKAQEIIPLFPKECEDGRLHFVIIPDISTPGTFDEAVKNVEAIVHTASPCVPEVNATVNDPEYLNRPAIEGTIGLLKSVRDHSARVKRVVITGSAVAATLPSSVPSIGAVHIDIFNDYVVDLVDKKGPNAPFAMQYAAAKTRSEKAVWEFVRLNTNLRFDVVMLLPPWVIGPELVKKTRIGDLNASNQRMLARFTQPQTFGDNAGTWVDIRVTAQAHVNALIIAEVGNMRLGVSNPEIVTNQDYYNAYHQILPPPNVPFTVPPPQPREQDEPSVLSQFLLEHLRLLRLEPTSLENSLKDTIDYLIHEGLLGLSDVDAFHGEHSDETADVSVRAKL
ncbi:NAD(P)-binding protein [Exidia glandulosa HHB12029]|uniref:NAD(P)-binding protein n=1 Tax=Exidia glandulosa HHB12029 TaxID=1314781 RepID=A0A166ASN5_EXIGL|nr:NAD(P)-binding protein [Exidia glandulosa HHB12029]